MNNHHAMARALSNETRRKVEHSKRCAIGYQSIKSQLGEQVARWAYADKGDGPGMRGPCASEQALDAWAPGRGVWSIVLCGVPGTGKTISAARYVADRRGSMMNARTIDTWGFEPGRKLDRAQTARLLLVDDLGEETSKVGTGHMISVLTARAAAGLPTVITTMLPLDGEGSIVTKYGDHVASRLAGSYRELYNLEDKDRRAQANASLTGFKRALSIIEAAKQVESVKPWTDPRTAASKLGELASLCGVDLDSDHMISAAAEIAEQAKRADQILADRAAALAEQPDPARLTDAETDALTWLDSLDSLTSKGQDQ